ncbi:cytochrome P450 [Xylaria intraflava]|nr:cytochrome P450 [Xylaria intraflava]
MEGTIYYLLWAIPVIWLYSYIVDAVQIWKSAKEYTVAGGLPALTPRFILNFNFSMRAPKLIRDGYRKYKDRAIQFVRSDGNTLILPYAVLEELAALPPTVAGPSDGLDKDLMGGYTGIDMILDNRIHHSVVQRRLTPRLPNLVPLLEKSITSAFKEYFPKAEEWTPITPFHLFAEIAARTNAPALVGPLFAQNREWLDIAIGYTEEIMKTMLLLRMIPWFMYPVAVRLLPSYWKARRCIQKSRKILMPKIREMLEAYDNGTWDPKLATDEADKNTLSWLAGSVKGRERNPVLIAHAELLLAFASTHTTITRVVNSLYDLMAADTADGSLTNELRAEIDDVAAGANGWNDVPYDRLHKLDSMLRESQRTSPTMLLGMKRVFKQPHTFQNGIHVPAGSFTAMMVAQIENDPAYTPNPEDFDALRWYREKQKLGLQNPAARDFDFSAVTRTALSFGYGRSACPGRFFASLVVKMIYVKMLTEYEFRFMPGQGRPQVMSLQDFLVTSPTQQILVRRRKGGVCPY